MRPDSRKTIAILLATFNGEQYLGEFLESLCSQTTRDFQIFARDDGSTDSTVAILDEYSRRLPIRILTSDGRLGPALGFLRILEEAGDQFDCYLFADQDDYWYHDKVARAKAALAEHVDHVALYCTRLEYVDDRLNHLKYSRIPRMLSLENAAVENVVTGCTAAITNRTRKEILAAKPTDLVMHDWWLYLYCVSFGRVIYDPAPSIKYRQHQGNVFGAATNALDDILRRLARFANRRKSGEHLLCRQISAFLNCHANRLTPPQRTLLNSLVVGRTTFSKRLELAIRQPFSRQSHIDTFILRFMFLFGWF